MQIRTYIAALLVTLILTLGCSKQSPQAADEEPAVASHRITRYQPDEVLKQRLVAGERALDPYLVALIKEADAFMSAMPRGKPQTAELVVAIRTNGQARFWCEFSSKAINANQIALLQSRLSKVSPPAIQGGPVAVGLQVSVWGGIPPTNSTPGKFYLPREWHDAVKKSSSSVLLPDGILPLVWPEK